MEAAPLCRSVLYLPSDKPRVLEKARTLAADALIFDLEDAVAEAAKPAARQAMCDALAQGGYAPRFCVVRVNALATPWGAEDMAAARGAQAVLVPKINTSDDVRAAHAALQAPALWAMVETPQALLNIADIAATASETALRGLVLGTNDLAAALGAQGRAAMQMALSLVVVAARAHGLLALDGVFNALDDSKGLTAEAAEARSLGYDGKTLIHPKQIDIANRVFAPDAAAVAEARAVLEAFAAPENAGKGVLRVNGKMVEWLHREQAARLIARADIIQERG